MGQNAILTVQDGQRAGSFDLDKFNKNIITIGRSRDCDIQVENIKVSGHHGQFYKQNGIWFYQDTNSTNGTIVNGNRIQQVSLNQGDVMIFDTVPGADSLRIDVSLMMTANQPYMGGVETVPPSGPGMNTIGAINDIASGIANDKIRDYANDQVAKSQKKKKILIASILSVVLIAAIVVAIILIVKKNGVNGSPEKCAVNLVEGLAERDVSKVKKSLHPQLSALMTSIEDMYDFGSVTVSNIKASTTRNVPASDLSEYKTYLKGFLNIDVDDAKIVNVKFVMSKGGNQVDGALDVTVIKCGSSWYVIDVKE
ncbi:FHA domain-containing protein [Eubacterium ruminantium]|nr:FHA domain-containing protein [Eubacterium ruminantium]